MTQFGSVRYSRAVRGTVWTQFREGGAALLAMQAGVVTVGGVEWQVVLYCHYSAYLYGVLSSGICLHTKLAVKPG